eukprot:CAMPEP_0204203546 /NCGR_PEP_ID=MMETSP0361-20130328/69008_1 /ASSEMBLY_ACC=CAM_ASM_000343 /TAXON_ID=268821 /ORGANISM="Scrippsiella Hangoei, Strain SHTV-5" /LENGTH=101 /DNA_ID=CAMNT_0051166513 /DNA_START=78 /DNA_END=383 /DNA_ORIENTATION=-
MNSWHSLVLRVLVDEVTLLTATHRPMDGPQNSAALPEGQGDQKQGRDLGQALGFREADEIVSVLGIPAAQLVEVRQIVRAYRLPGLRGMVLPGVSPGPSLP